MFDTDAAHSITPILDDFVTELEPVDSVAITTYADEPGITPRGVGVVSWTVRDTNGISTVIRDKSSRSSRCYLSTTVGLISQNNLRMVTAVTVDMKSRCQQLFITKKIMKAKS